MIERVTLIVNYNQYESKRHFTQKLAEAMNRKGIKTQILDVQEQALKAGDITSIRDFQPSFTCSFNSLMPVIDKTFLWDIIKIPHISFLVDPALYSVNLTSSPLSVISSVDRNDIAALQAYQFQHTFFWPHAVERELFDRKPLEKEFDVVFFGSCYDYESLREYWRAELPKVQAKALEDACDIVFSDNEISLADALIKSWNVSGLDFNDVDFLSLFYFLDYYTRGRDRVEMIHSIKNAHVHIFGELYRDTPNAILGWPQLLKSQNNLTIHPPVRYEEGLNLLHKSKICLNSMPFFRNGTHERIFMGLALDSLPITSESIFLRESFKGGESLIYYTSPKWGQVNDLVNEYLEDDHKRKDVILKGKTIVKQQHTWDVRVDQLIEAVPPILKSLRAS